MLFLAISKFQDISKKNQDIGWHIEPGASAS